jgi:hypothetical protein
MTMLLPLFWNQIKKYKYLTFPTKWVLMARRYQALLLAVFTTSYIPTVSFLTNRADFLLATLRGRFQSGMFKSSMAIFFARTISKLRTRKSKVTKLIQSLCIQTSPTNSMSTLVITVSDWLSSNLQEVLESRSDSLAPIARSYKSEALFLQTDSFWFQVPKMANPEFGMLWLSNHLKIVPMSANY